MARRRTPGEGTTYHDKSRGPNSKWVGEIVINGRRIRVYAKTEREAKAKLDVEVRALESGNVTGRKMTVGDLLRDWQTHRRETVEMVATTTQIVHDWAVGRFLDAQVGRRRFSEIKLSALTSDDVEAALADIARRRVPRSKSGSRSGAAKPLGVESVKRARAVLRMVLDYGIKKKKVGTNVARLAELPKVARNPEKKIALKPDAARRLETVLRSDPDAAVFYLMLCAGLRPQEAAGMALDACRRNPRTGEMELNIFRSARKVEIVPDGMVDAPRRRTRIEVVEELKNAPSRRTLIPRPETVAVLDAYIERNQDRLEAARKAGDLALLFVRADGQPLDPDVTRKRFRRLCEDHGIYVERKEADGKLIRRPPNPHELRHTFGTRLSEKKSVSPFEVSRELGHGDTRMFFSTYKHEDEETPRGAAASVDSLYG